MMYASSLEKYNECLEAFEQYKTVQNYENFYHHIESEYLNRPEKWALHARASMPTHGNHTNNYVESHFKIIKENVMHRHKCYNLPDFLDLMMKESSEYYRRICLSNGRFNPRQSKYKIPEKLSISREKVTKISDSIFMVESLRLSYIFQFAEWIGNIFPGCKITSGIHFTVSLSLFKFGAHSVWY